MTTLAAGATTVITLKPNQSLRVNGYGFAVVGTRTQQINSQGVIGPFRTDRTITLTANLVCDYIISYPNTTDYSPQYLGALSQVEIDAMNVQIAAGTWFPPTSATIFNTDTNSIWSFNGTALVDRGGSSVASRAWRQRTYAGLHAPAVPEFGQPAMTFVTAAASSGATQITVSSVSYRVGGVGSIGYGMLLPQTGGIRAGTMITGQVSGTSGGAGVYTISKPITAAGLATNTSVSVSYSARVLVTASIAAGTNQLVVATVLAGGNVLALNQVPMVAGLGAGAYITAVPGGGGAGTYTLSTTSAGGIASTTFAIYSGLGIVSTDLSTLAGHSIVQPCGGLEAYIPFGDPHAAVTGGTMSGRWELPDRQTAGLLVFRDASFGGNKTFQMPVGGGGGVWVDEVGYEFLNGDKPILKLFSANGGNPLIVRSASPLTTASRNATGIPQMALANQGDITDVPYGVGPWSAGGFLAGAFLAPLSFVSSSFPAGRKRAWDAFGNSIGFGAGAVNAPSFIDQIFALAGIPFNNLCISGSNQSQIPRWNPSSINAAKADNCIVEHLHNLIDTVSIATLYAALRKAGYRYIVATSTTNSTDAGNTTVTLDSQAARAWLYANLGNGIGPDEIWPVAEAVQDVGASGAVGGTGLWLSNSYVTDGVHPVDAGNTQVVNSLVNTYGVIAKLQAL